MDTPKTTHRGHQVKDKTQHIKREGTAEGRIPFDTLAVLINSPMYEDRKLALLDSPPIVLNTVIDHYLDVVKVAQHFGFKWVQTFFSWLHREGLIVEMYECLRGKMDEVLIWRDNAKTWWQKAGKRWVYGENVRVDYMLDQQFYCPPAVRGYTVRQFQKLRSHFRNHAHENIGRNRLGYTYDKHSGRSVQWVNHPRTVTLNINLG